MDQLEMGIALCRQGKYQEAITHFDQAIADQPNHTDVLYNRAKALAQLGKYDNALADLDQAISFAPYDAALISERGVLFFKMGENDRAMQDLDKAAALDPDNPYRYSSRAYLKAKFGDLHGAIEDYEKAIQLDPEDAIAYNNLGLAYEQLGHKDKSKQKFKIADALGQLHGNVPKQGTPLPNSATEPKQNIRNSPSIIPIWKIIVKVFTTKSGFLEFKTYVLNKVRP